MSVESLKLKEDHEEFISLLKMLPPSNTTVIEHYSCCEFCNCDCIAETSRRNMKCDKNNNYHKKTSNNTGRKKKKHKRSKSANSSYRSFSRDCDILKDMIYPELPKTPRKKQLSLPIETLPNNDDDILDLCEPMQNLCLSPRVRKAYKKVPVHDRKILNRMAKQRNDKAILNKNSWLAQKFWENEKFERELTKCEQDEEYRKAIREKQIFDNNVTRARLNALTKRDLDHLQRLREELFVKDIKLQDRLKHIKLDKTIRRCHRNQEAYRKSEAVQITQDEINLDDALRKQNICHRYENRLAKAEDIRNQYMNAYLHRLRYDNYLEQILHEENFKEVDKFERIKKERLKEEIQKKTYRTTQFINRRQKNYNNLVERAKISASLRDLVRRSVSPDGTQQYLSAQASNYRAPFNESPISNMSIQSYVRLG